MHKTYFDFIDAKAMRANHPIGDEFLSFAKTVSRDELFDRQSRLFMNCMARAWKIPFQNVVVMEVRECRH